MLSPEERTHIYRHAYVPEHLPDYVHAVSKAEAFLHEHHLCYLRGSHLIFIGYPLPQEYAATKGAFESACRRLRPASVAMIGTELPLDSARGNKIQKDLYYRLELPLDRLKPEQAYMIRRASRELKVAQGLFGPEHKRLIDRFVAVRHFEADHLAIFEKIGDYVHESPTALLLEARKQDEPVAFNVMDLGSENYAFYLFNFRSTTCNVPGASDLLFYEMAQCAQAHGKRAINLGLGINQGVRRFKEKWGAVPFLAYTSAVITMKRRHPWNLVWRWF